MSLAKLALEAGKPVLCEKPLCVNVREVKELIAFAQSKNLFLMEVCFTIKKTALDATNLVFYESINCICFKWRSLKSLKYIHYKLCVGNLEPFLPSVPKIAPRD